MDIFDFSQDSDFEAWEREDLGIDYDWGYSHDLGQYKIFECNYYNLDTFLQAIRTMPINRKVFHECASMCPDDGFYGTSSFEEAWNLCRFTQDKGYERFVAGLEQIKFKREEMEVRANSYKVVGYAPNVARLLCGNPCNMRVKTNVMKRRKITVNMNCDYSAYVSQNQVVNRGICVINLIQYLERRGFDVCLLFEAISFCNGEMIKIRVPIKRDDEKLNVKVCYFPLVNPSFHRRLIFRAKEIIEGVGLWWSWGYGYPYKKSDEEIMAMKNTIYISTPDEMGIKGISLEEDFRRFVNYVDNKYNLEERLRGDDGECRKRTYGNRV